MASAPTGCAAALIEEGSTHCQSYYIPTGKDFYKKTTNMINETNSESLCAKRVSMSNVVAQFIKNFLIPVDDTTKATSTVVIMVEVLRQDDSEFLSFS